MQLDPKKILQDLRATYWFTPSCMALVAIGLAFLMPWLDERYDIDLDGPFGWIAQTQTDGARSVLVAVAGSIIGVTGTTFSITMVAVSFASSNFGPRLIANFMRDRGNQLTLGTFIATFVYCLLVLRRVHDAAGDGGSADYDAFVPHLSVVVALLLALASVGVLIYFIHHVPETINIDRLVAQIGRDLRKSVESLFPDPDSLSSDDAEAAVPPWEARTVGCTRTVGLAREAGFVQRLHIERLVRLAEAHSLLLRMQYRPGDFVVAGDTLFEIWTPSTLGDAEQEADGPKVDEELLGKLRECIETSYQRTPHQDCLFLADQLVEVIARALSPGINDPFTAISCLGWLKGALIHFVECDAERPQRPEDSPVFVRRIEFEQLVAAAFDSTRQYVCADRNVALHAIAVLTEIGVRTERPEYRHSLRRRLDELRAASEAALAAEVGASDVARRHEEAVRLLDDAAARERRREGTDWFGGSG